MREELYKTAERTKEYIQLWSERLEKSRDGEEADTAKTDELMVEQFTRNLCFVEDATSLVEQIIILTAPRAIPEDLRYHW